MNGENILSPPICQFCDPDEKDEDGNMFYCMKEIGYGFEYCYDHWIILKALDNGVGPN